MRAHFILLVVVSIAALCATAIPAAAQNRKPTEKEILAVRDCVKARAGTEDGGDSCMFTLVASPCSETPEGKSNLGTADCYRIERTIWDEMLNENYGLLQQELEKNQKDKLRDMQRAWIVSRDRTCEFFQHKIQGSMAVPMEAACLLRETARRALLLKRLEGL
ncbi:MAG: DUF1311 domain-containing protein [Rhizobiales bacterium]|nr:DUF1311 domain-containing protein [Hyphomicrobiales bacterium]